MAMDPVAQPAIQFDVFQDTSFTESDQSSIDLGNDTFAPLGNVSVPSAQNRQSRRSSTGPLVESLASELEKLHIGESHEINQFQGKPFPPSRIKSQPGSHSARTSAAHNIFGVLETVPEDDNHASSAIAAVSVSDDSQHYIEVPVEQYTGHPLAVAACNLPSAQEQLAKHRRGEFEWVLTVRVPKPSSSDAKSAQIEPPESCDAARLYFGCNLFPSKERHALGDSALESYTLLVTPLDNNAELDTETELKDDEKMIALSGHVEHVTPSKPLCLQPEVRVEELSPASTKLAEDDSFLEVITSRSPAQSAARIEDSVEALDQLEEQLEAFDVAANMREVVTRGVDRPSAKSSAHALPPDTNGNHDASPHPKETATRTCTSALRGKQAEPKRSPSIRRSASMIFMDPPKLLDSPKLKVEDKALLQAPPKKSTTKELTSLLPPKQPVKSAKPLTIPAFELPGEAIARRLKEKREARLSMAASGERQQAPAISGPTRAKSVKPVTRPVFELPGEAISRRKREERDAKLKAQEEEERKRREFKARPIRFGGVPSSVPRDTATSRARQLKGPLPENATKAPNSSKRVSINVSCEPPTTASNQSQPRGRHPTADSSQVSRATSSSTGSISGKHSSVSMEDAQAQRLRGKDILRRDGMFSQDRQREKHEREALARLAREQAAERSRQQSRAWAEKQKRKRMTVGSLRDVIASSS
ncbi:hypothetical protein SUNI508_11055 [Seiridium unicorne]|uniref:Carboxylesterase family protein n=1 Tax=Seiridium unicorne TaxID=138068 RepID=A0ABR2UJ08_9PEZI